MTDIELNEKIALMMGYGEPITVYAWNDRKKKEYPMRRFSSHRLKKRKYHGGTYVYENGEKISWEVVLYSVPDYATDWNLTMEALQELMCESVALRLFGESDYGWVFSTKIAACIEEWTPRFICECLL